MFQRIQQYKDSSSRNQIYHKKTKSEGIYQNSFEIRNSVYQYPKNRKNSFALNSIHEREEDIFDQNTHEINKRITTIRAEDFVASVRSSGISSTSSIRNKIDHETSILKQQLQDKMLKAQLKMEQLKMGFKKHQKVKTQIIQKSQERRHFRRKELRI